MKAVLKTERSYGCVNIQDVPDPFLTKDNQVKIQVESAAVCGSDLHAYEYIDSYHWMKIPVVLGHECSGIVVEKGSNVSLDLGEKVMCESNKTCGVCRNCRTGNSQVCLDSYMRGLAIDGVMSQYVVMEERFVHRKPESLSFDEAAAAQACTVSAHAILDRSSLQPGNNVVVMGPGIVGLTSAQLARIKGASSVVVTGTDKDEAVRLPLARQLGFMTINVQKEDLHDKLSDLFGIREVDVVMECSGSPHAVNSALSVVKKGGELLLIGLVPVMEFQFPKAIRNEINLITSYTSTWKNYEQVLQLMDEKKIQINSMLHSYPLEEANNAIEDALSQKVVKPVLKP